MAEKVCLDTDVCIAIIKGEPKAEKVSDIKKELKSKGNIIEIRDIFIASTAINNNCILATFNKKHFSKINELKLLSFLI